MGEVIFNMLQTTYTPIIICKNTKKFRYDNKKAKNRPSARRTHYGGPMASKMARTCARVKLRKRGV